MRGSNRTFILRAAVFALCLAGLGYTYWTQGSLVFSRFLAPRISDRAIAEEAAGVWFRAYIEHGIESNGDTTPDTIRFVARRLRISPLMHRGHLLLPLDSVEGAGTLSPHMQTRALYTVKRKYFGYSILIAAVRFDALGQPEKVSSGQSRLVYKRRQWYIDEYYL